MTIVDKTRRPTPEQINAFRMKEYEVIRVEVMDRLMAFHPKRNIRSKRAIKPIGFPIHSQTE